MDNRIKKIIEILLIALVVISVIIFETIYPFVLGISLLIIIILERNSMSKMIVNFALVLWIVATVIIFIRHFVK